MLIKSAALVCSGLSENLKLGIAVQSIRKIFNVRFFFLSPYSHILCSPPKEVASSSIRRVIGRLGLTCRNWIFAQSEVADQRHRRAAPWGLTRCITIMAGDCQQAFNVVFVLGGPGAGKGTQCEKIEENFGFVHLSAGDLLRAEQQQKGSRYGEEIENHIKNGSIVPVEITCTLLRKAMEESKKQNFLIDGFPRNKDNLDGWNHFMSTVANVQKVLFFNCPEEVCVNRCMDRGKTSGRSDDNMESLKKRQAV